MREDRRVALKYISGSVDISTGAAHETLHSHLGMSKVCARWTSKMLIPEQKRTRVEACKQLLDQVRELGDAFLQRLVTRDESWFHLREPESKQDSMVMEIVLFSSSFKVQGDVFQGEGPLFVLLGPPGCFWCSGRFRRVAQWLDRNMQTSRTTILSWRYSTRQDHCGILLQQDNAPPHQSRMA